MENIISTNRVPKSGLFAFAVLLLIAVQFEAFGKAFDSLPAGLRSRGGLCVLTGGTENYKLAEKLLESGPWVIHWIDTRASQVDEVRRHFQNRGLYGRIMVEHWDKNNLPYADNLLNLFIGLDEGWKPDPDEVLRVLAPEGSAFLADGSGYRHLEKPRSPDMGEWTHPWQGADGSLASDDRSLGAPNTFQWIAGPAFPLDHRKNSTGVILSAGGRVFSITQNVPENIGGGSRNYLEARDAFNGVVLWSMPWEGPISQGHQDGYHEAIVVSKDRIYGARTGGVTVFDAADGRVLNVWKMTKTPDKLILTEGILVAQSSDGLTGFDVNTGELLWHLNADRPWGTLAKDGRVFCIEGTREQDGRWKHVLIAADLHNGEKLWQEPVESEYGRRNTAVLRLHFAGDGMVCLIERTMLRVVSAEDGRELWRRESEAEARGSGNMDSRQAGHFFVDGKLWMRANRARDGRTDPERWLALDPLTGEELREVITTGPQGVISNVNKVSCQPLTATSRYVLDARLSTIWDFETGQREGFKFARGGCQVGMIPANGMAYMPPNACGCLEEQLRANMAVVQSDDPGLHSFTPAPLKTGPAYGMERKPSLEENLSAWPMYRRDGRRGAYLPESVSLDLVENWKITLDLKGNEADGEWLLHFGRPLTPPVVADGLVALAEPQTHQVIALEELSGEERWRFTAGGRITTPPTLYRGLALFGSHDGYVYALRSSDGELVWRRRAAPSDRRIMAYGQLESTWPVAGGVLLHDGLALAVAGRATDAGGGLVVHAFEPVTGELQWTRRIDNARHGMCDPLVTDGRYVYLMNMQIDAGTGEVTELNGFRYGESERGGVAVQYPDGIRYLRGGKAGLLETSWTRLDMGLRKGQLSWTWGDIEGEMLAFTDHTAYAFHIDAGGLDNRGRQRMWRSPVSSGGGLVHARIADADKPEWSVELPVPMQIEAMLATPEALFISGPNDRAAPESCGFMSVISHDKGNELSKIILSTAPVHDGIAAANGNIVTVLRDGSVIRLGTEP